MAYVFLEPAAFGRLCVETKSIRDGLKLVINQPPSGGCVLKHVVYIYQGFMLFPAAFGRLCVETSNKGIPKKCTQPSRLRAAVC